MAMNRISRRVLPSVPVLAAVLLALTGPDLARSQDAIGDTVRRTTVARLGATLSGDRGLVEIASAQTLAKGQFSIGAGWSNTDRSPGDIDINALRVFAAYGVTGRLMLAAAFDVHTQITARTSASGFFPSLPFADPGFRSGPGDVEIRGKFRLQRMADNVGGMSLAGMLKLPAASPEEGLGTGGVDGGVELSFSSVVPLDLAVHSTFGFVSTSDATTPDFRGIKDELRGGVGIGWPARGLEVGGAGLLEALFEYRTVSFIGAGSPAGGVRSPNDLTAGVRYLHTRSGVGLTAGYRWNARFETVGDPDRTGFVFGLGYTRPGPATSANNAPVVVIEAATETLAAGQSLPITALAFDADNDTLSYEWGATGGTVAGSGSSITFTPPGVGTHMVSVTVRDGRGGTVSTDVTVTVE
jgi:hypothetical protein